MKYVTNNGVNMLLLVFELLDISLFPLQRKKDDQGTHQDQMVLFGL